MAEVCDGLYIAFFIDGKPVTDKSTEKMPNPTANNPRGVELEISVKPENCVNCLSCGGGTYCEGDIGAGAGSGKFRYGPFTVHLHDDPDIRNLIARVQQRV